MSLNKVLLIGRVGKDPKIEVVGDQKVAMLSLATGETFKKKDGTKATTTEWHNLVIWNKLADVAEKYVKKGMKIYIEGKLTTETWEKNSVTNYRSKIIVKNLQMLESNKKEM